MFVTKRKGCGKRFAMTCKFVKKFLLAMLVIHKRQHGGTNDKVPSGAEANYALYSEEIAENEANEALLSSLTEGPSMDSDADAEVLQYPVQCIKTLDGSFYWDDSMQQFPVDGDFIEVHDNSFRNLLPDNQWM